jgi:FAD/FMN-containing dehydrogenase
MPGALDRHRSLATRLRGPVLMPEDPRYDEARRVWNARIDRHPAAIAFVDGADDVAVALDYAARQGLAVAVRAGGHSPAGWSACDGGLVIDLRRLDAITIESDGSVTVGAGVIVADLIRRLDAQDRALPVGTCAGVGIAGLTLGGGIGHLNGQFGLTCDSLRWAEIVLADGSRHIASPSREPDLFWAIRGAGANFGIVTRFSFQAIQAPSGYGGVVAFTGRRRVEVVRAFSRLCEDAGNAAVLSVFWAGDVRTGEAALAGLRRLGEPAAGRLGRLRYATLAGLDEGGPARRAYCQRSANFDRLDADAIAAIADCRDEAEGAGLMTLIHRRHGAAARVPVADAAYPHRSPAFETTFAAAWAPHRAEVGMHRRVEAAWRAVGGDAAPVYVNMLDDEGPSRIAAAYGANHRRLGRLKARYDPDNRLRSNANLRPIPAGLLSKTR